MVAGRKGADDTVYGGLVEYTVFFASFFDAKKEYEQHRHSLRAIRKILRIYGPGCHRRGLFSQTFEGKKEFLSWNRSSGRY